MKDQEILDHFNNVIKPKLISSQLRYYKNQTELDQAVESLKGSVTDELINIGVDKSRIGFGFDGRNLSVNLAEIPEIHDISFVLSVEL